MLQGENIFAVVTKNPSHDGLARRHFGNVIYKT